MSRDARDRTQIGRLIFPSILQLFGCHDRKGEKGKKEREDGVLCASGLAFKPHPQSYCRSKHTHTCLSSQSATHEHMSCTHIA